MARLIVQIVAVDLAACVVLVVVLGEQDDLVDLEDGIADLNLIAPYRAVLTCERHLAHTAMGILNKARSRNAPADAYVRLVRPRFTAEEDEATIEGRQISTIIDQHTRRPR